MKYLFLVALTMLCACTLSSPTDTPPTASTETVISVLSGGVSSKGSVSGELALSATGETSTATGGMLASSQKLCVRDICIEKNQPYFTDGAWIIQIQDLKNKNYLTKLPEKTDGEYVFSTQDENSTYRITQITKDEKQAIQETTEFMGGAKIEYYIFPKGSVKIERRLGCAYSIKQSFFDTKGNPVPEPSLILPDYPKIISYGTIVLSSTGATPLYRDYHMPGFKFGGREAESIGELGTVSLQDQLGEVLKKSLRDKSSIGTYAYYSIKYREIPGVTLYYKNTTALAEAFLEAKIPTSAIDAKGNIIDISLTKDILALYPGGAEEVLSNNNTLSGTGKIYRQIRKKGADDNYMGIKLADFKPEMMPIFRTKLVNPGQFLLFPAEKYEGFSSAELCKPLVYIYDTNHLDNSLTIGFPHGGVFTRLIPQFSHGYTWDFRANAVGQVLAGGDIFPYLYYSARVPNYEYNRDGWQVYGRDMVIFFSEKLDVIGFNAREKSDFIDYWKHEFDADTLYFVSFKFDEAISSYVTLKFARTPTTQLRVLLEAYPIGEHFKNPNFLYRSGMTRLDAKLLKRFDRSGKFDVLEWGGTVQKQEHSPIVIH